MAPQPPNAELVRLAALLDGMAAYGPDEHGERERPVGEGAYRAFPLFETNADGVFCALQGRRLPAKRHPLGMQLRIDELAGDHVVDDGGDLWHRRIEELDAAACALCAHRYAVGHASWVGDAGGRRDRPSRLLAAQRVPARGRAAAGGAPPAPARHAA